jgi:hypothetical protein
MAGVMLMLILFTAQVFNETLEENKRLIEGWLKNALAPILRFRALWTRKLPQLEGTAYVEAVFWPLTIIGLTVMIYSSAEPNFGFNTKSLIVVASLFVCVSLLTYIHEGGKAFMARRHGAIMGVRPYPFAILLAIVNVVIARALDFGPGVLYGFAGQAVFLQAHRLRADDRGRIAFWPFVVLLGISATAYLLVTPLRSIDNNGKSPIPVFFEGVAVALAVGGLQTIFFSLIPLRFLDGERILRWNKLAWLGLSGLTAFAFWHILLNGQRDYSSAVTSTAPIVRILAKQEWELESETDSPPD